MKTQVKWISPLVFAAALVGCGGSSYTSGGGGGGTVTTALGSGTGSSFQAGVLQLSSTNLSAGGSATITATLQNSDGTAYTQSTTVTFTSPCFQNSLATFTISGVAGNAVTTTTGTATVTYGAQGCSGADPITATATVNSSNLSASGTVTVAPSTIGSIQFVSAKPPTISLKGVGGTETSTVIFKVVGSTGGPVPGATVSFTLDSTAGGLSLSPTSAVSGNDGSVQTIVQSGTVSTTVRVTATVTTPGGNISTQSSALLISTGFPTEFGFSLGAVTYNPEGGDIDGTTDAITARLADNFGNPAPDGTQVYFTTTGGSIQPGCTTTGGACTVTWTSQNPRPDPSIKAPAVLYHAEIMAYAIGEESWTDNNANGLFDGGDTFSLYPGGFGDNFYQGGSPANHYGPLNDDIGELYLDQGESGSYKTGDWFFDFNQDGVRNGPDGMFHGGGCVGNGTVTCAPKSSIAVGLQICLVMATSEVGFLIPPGTTQNPNTTIEYLATDLNGNVPSSGTTYAIVVSGATATLQNAGAEPVLSCAGSPPGSGTYGLFVNVSPTSAAGSFYITAKSPSGLVSFSNTVTVP
ncbi:MAG TPA: hypothetical protein VNF46_04390 [Gammaproteobacteria bacterium]|nr:hypothetical protein [Gammaproteobacteria bacterium]